MRDYETIARQAQASDAATLVAWLDVNLPDLWAQDYGEAPNLLAISARDDGRSFCRYLFDHAGAAGPDAAVEDRVVAVWGVSAPPPAPRDAARLQGFLRGVWSRAFRGDDRGHFFAHTMGGGLDINLFPQSARLNRGGLWRRMENYAARHPGTFCFVRPIYDDPSWRPARLEFGLFKTATADPAAFWGHVFDNTA
jgi:hypothetical protein